MSKTDKNDLAEQSLSRVLGFFSRVESKSNYIFAIDSGMLGLVALNFSYEDICVWYSIVPATITVTLIAFSIYYVYRCMFPQLKGSRPSIVYFKDIADRDAEEFVEAFLATETETYTRDLIDQTWRNSQILSEKFRTVKISFILTALAIMPWFLFLAVSAARHDSLSF